MTPDEDRIEGLEYQSDLDGPVWRCRPDGGGWEAVIDGRHFKVAESDDGWLVFEDGTCRDGRRGSFESAVGAAEFIAARKAALSSRDAEIRDHLAAAVRIARNTIPTARDHALWPNHRADERARELLEEVIEAAP